MDRRQSEFFQLTEDTALRVAGWTLFKVLIALLGAYLVLVVVSITEGWLTHLKTCQDLTIGCLGSHLGVAIQTDNIEGFSIVVLSLLYTLEGRDRQRKRHYEAWQVIDNAAAAGVAKSYARLKALEDLSRDGSPMKGINLAGADLEGIELRGAVLSNSNLERSILDFASLQGGKVSGRQVAGR